MNTKILLQNKKLLAALGALVVIGALAAGYWLYTHPRDEVMIPTSTEKVIAEEFNLSFSYPVGDDALTLVEPPVENQSFKKAYLLMSSTDYAEFQKATEAREAPATISVFVYELSDAPEEAATSTVDRPNRITRLQNWARDNAVITSFNLAQGTPDIVEIDGVKALHYRADGLYQQDIYLASYSGNVYMFTSQFNADTDLTYTTFQTLIASISFD